MLLPFFGLVFGVVVSTCLGVAVIALHPRWKLTFANVAWFVGGAFAGAISSSLLYTWAFADAHQQLHSGAAVIGFFATLGAATLLGGTLAVYLGRRLGSQAA
jgi:hypothetical protein